MGVKCVCVNFHIAFEIKFNKQFFSNLQFQFTTFILTYVNILFKEQYEQRRSTVG